MDLRVERARLLAREVGRRWDPRVRAHVSELLCEHVCRVVPLRVEKATVKT